MPAFNAERYVEAAVSCLMHQSLTDFELIAIDDASTDRTPEILADHAASDQRIRFSRNERNSGYLRTWNQAIGVAKGRYVTFLDADDLCRATRLQALHEFLVENPDYGICGSASYFVDEWGRETGIDRKPLTWPEIRQQLLAGDRFPFCGSAVMVTRNVVEAVGGYREFFDRVGWEDHDWLLRCCERFRAANLKEDYYGYRLHQHSVTRTVDPNSIRKLTIRKIGLDLARERASNGSDCLMTGDDERLREIIARYEQPYERDPTLILRIMAARAADLGDWDRAWSLTREAIVRRPANLRNYKLAVRNAWRALASSDAGESRFDY
jgi:glycosyltransferase involved in cell wall biosynthesis